MIHRGLAVVTGASRGIGLAIARELIENGYDLFLHARSLEALQPCLEWKSEFPDNKILTHAGNLGIKSDVQTFANLILGVGVPTVLVNNAGTFKPGSVLMEEESIFEEMIQVNLASAYHLTRALAPSMKLRRSGDIVNMCSIASIEAYPNGGSYCISKFGLLGMTKVLREELKDFGVRVTAILPGATYTDSWKNAGFPPERFISPESVARTVVHCVMASSDVVHEEVIIRPQLGDI